MTWFWVLGPLANVSVSQQKMLDDLIELSDAYVLENRSLRQRGHQGNLVPGSPVANGPNVSSDIPYGDSQTSRRQDSILNGSGADDAYGQDRYATQLSYSAAGPQPGYPTPGQPNGYPGPAYPPGPGYSQVSTYPSGSGYPAPSYLATAQPGTNYTYRDDYPSSVDPYRQTGAYPSAGRPREVRAERAEPRYPGPDMRDLRMDPRDPRADPRADPRNLPNYSSYVTSPGDVSMRDADPGYDYVSALPTVQSGRGGSFAPSRVAPSGYDPRDSPLRDGYRNEPIREERRRR